MASRAHELVMLGPYPSEAEAYFQKGRNEVKLAAEDPGFVGITIIQPTSTVWCLMCEFELDRYWYEVVDDCL